MELLRRALGSLPDAAWRRRQFTLDADAVHDAVHWLPWQRVICPRGARSRWTRWRRCGSSDAGGAYGFKPGGRDPKVSEAVGHVADSQRAAVRW